MRNLLTTRFKYHIVFIPKYRRKIIYNKLRRDIVQIIKDLCKWKGIEIIEDKAMPDHIYILVKIPPKMSISNFMGFYRVFKRKKCNDDICKTWKFKI